MKNQTPRVSTRKKTEMNKFVKTTVGLINPIREDGKRVEGEAEGMTIVVEHIAPNSVRVAFPSFLALVRELEYLQAFYKTHTKDIPK